MTPRRTRLFLLALLLAATALPLRAQEVRLEGAGDDPAVRLAREILAAGSYLRLARDTVLPKDFRAPGDLVVVDADVRLDGTVEGRVAVLGGVLFVRPGARVGGAVANVGGEVYPSALATTGEIVEAGPELRVGVEFDTAGARVRVEAPGRGPRLVFPGVMGVRLPTYDRVNGLTVAAGPALLLTGDPEGPRVDAWAAYHAGREDFGGGASARAPLGSWLVVEARVERATLTNERWYRGDLDNTLGSLFLANDHRDYRESDRAALSLARVHREALIAGEWAWEPRVVVQAMRDRSLPARVPWSLWGDFERPNPPVREAEWASAVVGTGVRWQGQTAAFRGDAALERSLPVLDETELTQWTADGLWTMQAMRRHTLAVRFRALGTLGDDPAPPQRRTILGGVPTLPTFDVAHFRGDRLAWVESAYGIPFRKPRLPFLGPPTLRLTHRAGAAWLTGEPMPAWEQNLGAGLGFSFARADLFVDPADPDHSRLAFALVLPF